MEVTKKITIRCPQDRYINLKEKLEKLNMTQSEYLNTLIENDLKDNNVVLNQKELICGISRISTHINDLVEKYPDDEDVRALKKEVRSSWQILSL
ncbi:hypothetical protein [Lacrimispora sp.]|uniref:hypothetical protein n=1 Tax=Lacrimispora sp. TaxID=2719234 RepID=UPI0028982E55|nr:hypothetical protein [Lacrimispora sp.]